MKKLFIISAITLIFGSCENYYNGKSDYYVRYSASAGLYQSIGSISYKDDGGVKITSCNDRSWKITIGPVKKGFAAKLSTSNARSAIIEVSKDNGPFVQKAAEVKSASYVINF